MDRKENPWQNAGPPRPTPGKHFLLRYFTEASSARLSSEISFLQTTTPSSLRGDPLIPCCLVRNPGDSGFLGQKENCLLERFLH